VPTRINAAWKKTARPAELQLAVNAFFVKRQGGFRERKSPKWFAQDASGLWGAGNNTFLKAILAAHWAFLHSGLYV